MNGGIGISGSTSAWKEPTRSPPTTLTAPTSVIRLSVGDPPVVSRSTTLNVTWSSGILWSNVVWIGAASTGSSVRWAVRSSDHIEQVFERQASNARQHGLAVVMRASALGAKGWSGGRAGDGRVSLGSALG